MQKRKKEILNIIKQEILNNIKSYVIVTIIFIIGIFLGVLFINQTESKDNILQYINTYIDEMKTLQNVDFLGGLKNDIHNNILLVLLLWFAGTTIIGIPIVFGTILTRGFCLGYTISACVLTLGKWKGFMFILLTIFLQNAIFIPSLLVLGVSSVKLYKSIIKDRRKENIKLSIFKHSIISLFILFALIISSILKIEVSYRLTLIFSKYF